MSHLLLAC